MNTLKQYITDKTKRSSYTWSGGPDYSPDDYANEGQLALAQEILLLLNKLDNKKEESDMEWLNVKLFTYKG
jgi:hypothetical protein